MNDRSPATAISPLRQRLIDDMNMRRFSRETQRNYIRDVGRFATFLRRSPDTATADDVRRFQIEQRDAGVPTPTMNSCRRCGSSSRTRSTGPIWHAR
jgi:integrase/recombinase XerD